MAYVEVHEEVYDHPKTIKAAGMLGVSEVTLVGHLSALWTWATHYAPNGDMSEFEAFHIAKGARWPVADAERFVRALIECRLKSKSGEPTYGFLEESENGSIRIHDWAQYGGKLHYNRTIDAFRKWLARNHRPISRPAYEEWRRRTGNADAPEWEDLPFAAVPDASTNVQPVSSGHPADVRSLSAPSREDGGRRSEKQRAEEQNREERSVEQQTAAETDVPETSTPPVPSNGTGQVPVKSAAAAFSPNGQGGRGSTVPPASAEIPPGVDAALVRELQAADVNRPDAIRLAGSNPEECRRQLAYLPFVKEFRKGRGAYLRSAIEGAWAPPAGYLEATEKASRQKIDAGIKQAASEREQAKKAHEATIAARVESVKETDPETFAQITAEAARRLPEILQKKPEHAGYAPALQGQIRNLIAERFGPMEQSDSVAATADYSAPNNGTEVPPGES